MPVTVASTFFTGLAFAASLLVSIGPQNANLLRRGLLRRWAFATALICSLCDLVLISVGIGGFGTVVATSPWIARTASWGGAIFLGVYAVKAFQSAWSPPKLDLESGGLSDTRQAAVSAALAFSLLNPHVYLDTVVLIGGMGGQFPLPERLAFGIGAVLGAFVWFFSLAFWASRLARWFKHRMAWRLLDAGVGVLSLYLALSFLRSALRVG